MRRWLFLLLLAAVFTAGVATGVLTRSSSERGSRAETPPLPDAGASRDRDESAAVSPPPEAPPTTRASSLSLSAAHRAARQAGPARALRLASVAEAEDVYRRALSAGDLGTLIELAAALLDMGEEGRTKLLELWNRLHDESIENPGLLRPWKNPSGAGRLLRAAVEHKESLLLLLLFLEESDGRDLPESLRELRRDTAPELRNLVLGLAREIPPPIEKACLDVLGRSLDDARAEPDRFRSALWGIALLQSPEATDTLVGLLDAVPEETLPEVVQAIGYHGDARALPALEALRDRSHDTPDLFQTIYAAMQALRGKD